LIPPFQGFNNFLLLRWASPIAGILHPSGAYLKNNFVNYHQTLQLKPSQPMNWPLTVAV